MAAVMIDGPMITQFVKDNEEFSKSVLERFKMLDVDGDGLISLDNLSKGGFGKWLIALDDDSSDDDIQKSYNGMFEKFMVNGSNALNFKQFQEMVSEILLALARGIGNHPLMMLLSDGSLLLKACV